MPTVNITPPSSKSLINRALAIAALRIGPTILTNISFCDDTKYMIAGLKKLGADIEIKKNTLKITHGITICSNFPQKHFKKVKKIKIFTGNAGTATRFLTSLCVVALSKVGTNPADEIIIDGDERMRTRPISELVKALNKLGANIKSTNGHLPLTISKTNFKSAKIAVRGDISSQFISSLLMTLPITQKPTSLSIEQELCSKPYVQMTLKLLEKFGFRQIKNKNLKKFQSFPSKCNKDALKKLVKYEIETDASGGSYIGALSALHPKIQVRINNLPRVSLQGDILFLKYLKKMGCQITQIKDGTIIRGPLHLKSLKKIDFNETPDLVMTFAVLAMFTARKTTFTNIANLREKESDRLQALETEIKKFGIKVSSGKDFLEIEGNPNLRLTKKITIETYNDHRIAMTFGIITTVFSNIIIKNKDCVSKSYVAFWKDLQKFKRAL